MNLAKLFLAAAATIALGFLNPGIKSDNGIAYNQSYPEQLPGTYTGGFGEQSCHHCHFDYPLNANPGWINMTGWPAKYQPDSTYLITVSTGRNQLIRAGFQLSARRLNGSNAGYITIFDERTAFTFADTDSIQYIQHSVAGSIPSKDNRLASWKFKWTAPSTSVDTLYMHLAANAANGDASEFGDYINTMQIVILPSTGQ